MKRIIFAILSLMVLLTACFASPEETPALPEETQPPQDIALALCVPSREYSFMRELELGFIEQCEQLGIDDFQIIGTKYAYSEEKMFKAALDWAKSVQGKRAGLLLFNASYNSEELLAQLSQMGICVGILHFEMYKDGIIGNGLADNISFCCFTNKDEVIDRLADRFAEFADGKKGTILLGQAGNYDIIAHGIADKLEMYKNEGKYKLDDVNVELTHTHGSLGEQEDIASALETLEKYPDIIGAYRMFSGEIEVGTRALNEMNMSTDDVLTVYLADGKNAYETCLNTDNTIIYAYRLYDEGAVGTKKLVTLLSGGKTADFERLSFDCMDNAQNRQVLLDRWELIKRAGEKPDSFFDRYIGKFLY